MKGTLNFYDSPEHVCVYDVNDFKDVFEKNHFKVLKYGIRRNYYYLALSFLILPMRFVANGGFLKESDLYDFNSFCTIIYAKKK